jgi:hypothetical protein
MESHASTRRQPLATTGAVLASIALLSVSASPFIYAGVLGDAASETRDGNSSSGNARHDCDDDDEEGLGSLIFELLFGWMIDSAYEPSEKQISSTECGGVVVARWYELPDRDDEFTPFPYSQDNPGILVPMDHRHVDSYYFSGRFAFEYGDDLDTIDRFAGTGLVEWRTGLGFDASGHIYRESLPTGGRDELSVGDVNVLWRMIQAQRAQIRLGIGMNWLSDSIDVDQGVNLTARGDIFPFKPVILSGELDFGTIGDATTLHARGSAGVNIGQTEFFVGYDYRSIGSVHIEGPMLGVQFWY